MKCEECGHRELSHVYLTGEGNVAHCVALDCMCMKYVKKEAK